MTKDKFVSNGFNGNKILIDSHCLDFCHLEIAYATQLLVAELSIAKSLAAHISATDGGC
jgi:hypothetical protein